MKTGENTRITRQNASFFSVFFCVTVGGSITTRRINYPTVVQYISVLQYMIRYIEYIPVVVVQITIIDFRFIIILAVFACIQSAAISICCDLTMHHHTTFILRLQHNIAVQKHCCTATVRCFSSRSNSGSFLINSNIFLTGGAIRGAAEEAAHSFPRRDWSVQDKGR